MSRHECSYCGGPTPEEPWGGEAFRIAAERSWWAWLSRVEWTAFPTLTFKGEPGAERAMAAARRWTEQLETKVQRELPFIAVVEREPRLHVHALLALPHRRFTKSLLEDLWPHGRVHVHEAPGSFAVRYVARKIAVEDQIIMPRNLRTRARKLRRHVDYVARRNGRSA